MEDYSVYESKKKKKTFIVQPNGHQARLVMQVQPNQS